jgi:hypothetical protein
MKAAVVTEWGETPRYIDFPDPQPRDDAVVATVEASALTNLTRGLVSGKHYASKELTLPAVPGVDGVARLDDGRRVYTGALAPYGMMAERTLISPQGALDLPDGVDSVVAAAVPNPGLSAWMSLEHGAAVQQGANVLVLGATGVTGSMAVQLAKSVFDAGRVVAAGRDVARLDWLQTVGADDAIALDADDVQACVAAMHAERPFDVVLDYLWGPPAEGVLTALSGSHPSVHYHLTRFIQIGLDGRSDVDAARGHPARQRHRAVGCRHRQRSTRRAREGAHRGTPAAVRHGGVGRPAIAHACKAFDGHRRGLDGRGVLRHAGGADSLAVASVDAARQPKRPEM